MKNSPKLLKIYIIKKIHGKDVVLRQLIINQKGIEGIVLKMSDIQKKLDHINITQLIEKELKGIYGKKKLKILQSKKMKSIRHFVWPYRCLHC